MQGDGILPSVERALAQRSRGRVETEPKDARASVVAFRRSRKKPTGLFEEVAQHDRFHVFDTQLVALDQPGLARHEDGALIGAIRHSAV